MVFQAVCDVCIGFGPYLSLSLFMGGVNALQKQQGDMLHFALQNGERAPRIIDF